MCLTHNSFLYTKSEPTAQKLIYTSLRQYQLSSPQTQSFEHIVHCLGALRSDVLCAADDTPRFTGDPDPHDDFQQHRQCRDWSELEAWAVAHSACFHRVGAHDPHHDTLYEWANCPEGSPYQETIEDYFREMVDEKSE